MPVYPFRCSGCGPFDVRRTMSEDTGAAPCPSCGRPAARTYTAPGTRLGSGPLRGAGRTDRARIDRARSGEPTITGRPSGRRLPPADGHRH